MMQRGVLRSCRRPTAHLQDVPGCSARVPSTCFFKHGYRRPLEDMGRAHARRLRRTWNTPKVRTRIRTSRSRLDDIENRPRPAAFARLDDLKLYVQKRWILQQQAAQFFGVHE